jgi:hypothetical protein
MRVPRWWEQPATRRQHLSSLVRVRLKCTGHRAPARVFDEYGLLLIRGEPVFTLNSLQRPDRFEIRLRFLPWTALTDSVSVAYASVTARCNSSVTL